MLGLLFALKNVNASGQSIVLRLVPNPGEGIALGMFGLGPWLAGMIFVEVAAFVLPPLRGWRLPEGRRKWAIASWVVGAVVLALEVAGYVMWASSQQTGSGPIVASPLELAASLFVGSLLCLLVVTKVGQRGLGSPFSVAIFGLGLTDVLSQVQHARMAAHFEGVDQVGNLLSLGVLAFCVVVGVFGAGRTELRRDSFPAAGLVPFVPALFAVPLTGVVWVLVNGFASEPMFRLQSAVGAAAAVLIAGPWLWWAGRRRGQDAKEVMQNTALVVVGVAAAMGMSSTSSLRLEPLVLVTLVGIARDYVGEFRFLCQHPGIHLLATTHDIDKATTWWAQLEDAGIDVFARGLHHRLLWRFFAPWVPVELLVDADDATAAHAVLTSTDDDASEPVDAPQR